MCILYTAGYEQYSIDCFINELLLNKIEVIIDVRELPLSRKFGFSKTRLKNALNSKNIDYIHFRQLGSPREIRHKLHNDNDYESFFQEYRDHVNDEHEYIERALDIIKSKPSCLLCFESEVEKCHRSVLAQVMTTYSDVIDEVIDIS